MPIIREIFSTIQYLPLSDVIRLVREAFLRLKWQDRAALNDFEQAVRLVNELTHDEAA